MRGSYGLVLVLFGLIVGLMRILDLGTLRQLPIEWLLAIGLLFAFGLAWLATAILVRMIVRVRIALR